MTIAPLLPLVKMFEELFVHCGPHVLACTDRSRFWQAQGNNVGSLELNGLVMP